MWRRVSPKAARGQGGCCTDAVIMECLQLMWYSSSTLIILLYHVVPKITHSLLVSVWILLGNKQLKTVSISNEFNLNS